MKKLILSFGLVLAITAAYSAQAAEFLLPSENESNITVPAGTRNVYTAGNSVSVNNSVSGDLFVAGNTVTVSAGIEQDLFSAGRTVVVTAPVGGDVRAAAETINLNSTVGGDVLAAAATINLPSSSVVSGDLIVGGADVTVDGPVSGKVLISGDKVRINSRIGGEVKVEATTRLVFGPQAEIAGKISYKGPEAAVIEDGARVSTVDFTPIEGKGRGWAKGLLSLGALAAALGFFVAAWLFVAYKPVHARTILNQVSVSPLASLGLGLVFFFLTPIVIGLLFWTLVGSFLAILLGLCYLLLLALSVLLVPVYAGDLILQRVSKTREVFPSWKSIIIGIVVTAVLFVIPFVNVIAFLAFAIIFFMILGSMLMMLKYRKPVLPESTPGPAQTPQAP